MRQLLQHKESPSKKANFFVLFVLGPPGVLASVHQNLQLCIISMLYFDQKFQLFIICLSFPRDFKYILDVLYSTFLNDYLPKSFQSQGPYLHHPPGCS